MKLLWPLLIAFIFQQAHAVSIDWSGGYRIEYNSINRPSLAEPKKSKNYALNYLYLEPKIIGSDGINIISRFDIMASRVPAYKNSQVGSLIGGGLNDGTGATGSNVNSQNQNSSQLQISQLYLNVDHEYGSLIVGRAPIEFGMGITHNAGRGAFDHWIDTKEMITYRFFVDNISFAPMMARVSQEDFGGGVAHDQIYIFEYDNKDIGARAGLFHQTRTAGQSYNDYLLAPSELPGGNAQIGSLKTQTINIFLERRWPSFEFKIEASFLTGNTGIQTASGDEIQLDSYAVVSEVLVPAKESSFEYGAKLGVVSGDNSETTAYEGYQLDRNYDIGILLFNHRMSTADVLGTGVQHANDNRGNNNLSLQNSVDDVAVTNTMFLAPSFKYIYSEKLDFKSTLIYAQLMTVDKNNFVDMKKDLGLELDIEVIYKPRQRVTWSTGVGVLFPGSAWKAGNNNLDTKTNYGLTTKAAITF